MADGIITAILGLFATLIGFQVLPLGTNSPQGREAFRRFGPVMKVCGLVTIAFGVFQILTHMKW